MTMTNTKFTGFRGSIKRMPHTSPDKCKGHEYYLDRKIKYSPSTVKCWYYCRYCGTSLEATL